MHFWVVSIVFFSFLSVAAGNGDSDDEDASGIEVLELHAEKKKGVPTDEFVVHTSSAAMDDSEEGVQEDTSAAALAPEGGSVPPRHAVIVGENKDRSLEVLTLYHKGPFHPTQPQLQNLKKSFPNLLYILHENQGYAFAEEDMGNKIRPADSPPTYFLTQRDLPPQDIDLVLYTFQGDNVVRIVSYGFNECGYLCVFGAKVKEVLMADTSVKHAYISHSSSGPDDNVLTEMRLWQLTHFFPNLTHATLAPSINLVIEGSREVYRDNILLTFKGRLPQVDRSPFKKVNMRGIDLMMRHDPEVVGQSTRIKVHRPGRFYTEELSLPPRQGTDAVWRLWGRWKLWGEKDAYHHMNGYNVKAPTMVGIIGDDVIMKNLSKTQEKLPLNTRTLMIMNPASKDGGHHLDITNDDLLSFQTFFPHLQSMFFAAGLSLVCPDGVVRRFRYDAVFTVHESLLKGFPVFADRACSLYSIQILPRPINYSPFDSKDRSIKLAFVYEEGQWRLRQVGSVTYNDIYTNGATLGHIQSENNIFAGLNFNSIAANELDVNLTLDCPASYGSLPIIDQGVIDEFTQVFHQVLSVRCDKKYTRHIPEVPHKKLDLECKSDGFYVIEEDGERAFLYNGEVDHDVGALKLVQRNHSIKCISQAASVFPTINQYFPNLRIFNSGPFICSSDMTAFCHVTSLCMRISAGDATGLQVPESVRDLTLRITGRGAVNLSPLSNLKNLRIFSVLLGHKVTAIEGMRHLSDLGLRSIHIDLGTTDISREEVLGDVRRNLHGLCVASISEESDAEAKRRDVRLRASTMSSEVDGSGMRSASSTNSIRRLFKRRHRSQSDGPPVAMQNASEDSGAGPGYVRRRGAFFKGTARHTGASSSSRSDKVHATGPRIVVSPPSPEASTFQDQLPSQHVSHIHLKPSNDYEEGWV